MNATERKKMIAERKERVDPPHRIWCKDDWQLFDVYKVPVDALALNVENRRFQAERKLMEDQLGRTLDPENNPDDELSVVSILLDTAYRVDGGRVVGKPSKDYEELVADWKRRKQETPLWIRPDGTVRNGNRRLATVKRLRVSEGAEGREWINAIILASEDVDEQALFEMEQREQLTENLKVRYTDINLLLTLRDAAIARGVDWADPSSVDRVAGELQHVTKNDRRYAVIQLRAIRYMDAFLDDSNAKGQYEKLIRQVENFRDIGKLMVMMEDQYPDDAQDALKLAFAAVRAGNRYTEIRALRKMYLEDRDRFRKLHSTVEKIEENWAKDNQTKISDPKIVDKDEDDEMDGPPESTGPEVPNYPKDVVNKKIKSAIDGFTAAQNDVATSLEQAMSRLEAVDAKNLSAALKAENGDDVRAWLDQVLAWAETAKGAAKKAK